MFLTVERLEREYSNLMSGKTIDIKMRLREEYKDVIEKVENGTLTYEELEEFCFDFDTKTKSKHYEILKAVDFLTEAQISYSKPREMPKKQKGDYTISDKTILGIINAVESGRTLQEACQTAGISYMTAYRRLKEKGISVTKIKERGILHEE